jgi:streptogramin lyase
MRKSSRITLLVLMSLAFAAAAWAVAPAWMPSFPMRMGAAGVMGMWMPVPGATEYKVQRQVAGGAWEDVYKGPMNNFQDPTAPADKDVAYRVIAVIGGADSEPSPVVALAGQKPVLPPTDIRTRLDTANRALGLGWSRSEGGSFYNVYRADKAGDAGTLLGSVQDLKYTDAAVEDGKSYWYYITAVGGTGQESARADPVKVDVSFPKEVRVKKFEFNSIPVTLVRTTQGEDFAEFKNPSDLLLLGERLYVACEDGVQVVDADGRYLNRLPLLQEKVASRAWNRPNLMSASPAGNIFFSFVNENLIREVTPDGTSLVREIVVPDVPGAALHAMAGSIAVAPDGTRWVSDVGYSTLAALPPGAGDAPAHVEIRRYGFPKGGAKYDPAKDGDVFVGAGRIRYLPDFGKLFVQEAAAGKLSAVDPSTGKKEFEILGLGGGMNQVSLLSDFVPYDGESVLIADSLKGEIKRIRIAKAGDDTNGDYLATLVDDPDGKLPKLQAMASNVTRLQYDPARKRLYGLSVPGREIAIYTLP